MKDKSRTPNQGTEDPVEKWEKIPKVSSLYRYRPSGMFHMVARINRKLVWQSLKTKDLATAKRKVEDTKRRRRNIKGGNISFVNLAGEYLISKNGKNQTAIQTAINRIKENCPFINQMVSKIGLLDVTNYFSGLKLPPRTNNLTFEIFSGIFDLGVSAGYIEINPIAGMKKQFRQKYRRKIPNIPTLEQFEKIVETVRNQKFSDTGKDSANLIQFMGLAALGTAEATALTWSMVDWERERIKVIRKKTKEFYEVPIYPFLKPFLLDLWEKAHKSKTGSLFKIQNPKKAIITACTALDFPQFTARTFRQMGIVRLLRAGIPPKLVAKYQGHTDGGVLIMNTYSQVISDTDSDYEKNMLERLSILKA